jgi:outer membrane receptor protein involved in Fe transport
MKRNKLSSALMLCLGAGASAYSAVGFAQEGELEEVIITGSRITQPGVVSSSPITSISAEEIGYLQEPEVEKILRTLPGTIPGDGGNVNNGTAGAATVDLRGLGPERTLVLMNGKRMTPYNYNGEVDTATIPTALIERIDVVTGGASAVYGSDAIAGAINFVLKRDFQGVELSVSQAKTGENDGETNNVSFTVGSDLADGRGNVALSLAWMDRKPILLGQRPLGLLGIDTETGANYEQFLAGQPPLAPPAGCGGPNVVAAGGSTTSIPTRFAIVGGGAASSGQFREDRTIGTECSRFNFNPFNYYQTPMERYSATAIGHFEIIEHAEVYSTINFTNTTVVQQVAPSGTFGATFDLPLRNPLIGDQARQFMIDAGNTALANGLLSTTGAAANWQDINGNGVVDADDYLKVQLRRRTLELGTRTERYDSDQFQFVVGSRGEIAADWDYDVSFSYGESNRTTVRGGYTNLTNIQNALDSFDGVTCNNGDSTCVPIDLFGGFGTITEEMAAYAQAIALQQQKYEQTIFNLSVNGPIEAVQLPWASSPLLMSFGYEKRRETGILEPDECLKLAPSSCQGGAGGNLLPISGGYKADEFFMEAILPLVEGATFAENLALELGYRTSDYDVSSGSDEAWKVGLNWRPVDTLLVRVMQQQATRAPNVGELASPVVTGLDNAKQDPCSVANAANIDARLRDLCISTGMSAAQVGQVQDVISGQVNTFDGSDPASLPASETADTFTAGFVWTPDTDIVDGLTINVDYYNIDVEDIIGEFSAQEILDACYVTGDAGECAKIRRVGGDLTIAGSGVERFTTNLLYEKAEGIEIGFSFGYNLGDWGDLQFSGNINKYLTQESQSSAQSAVIDCKGFYGTSCDPISDIRWIQRTSWLWNNFNVSLQWRHIGSVDIEPVERDGVFEAFRKIDAYDYFDLFASYTWQDRYEFSLGIDNLTEEDPPVVGNEAGDTSSNSGNTFPSNYDVLGRVFTARFTATF